MKWKKMTALLVAVSMLGTIAVGVPAVSAATGSTIPGRRIVQTPGNGTRVTPVPAPDPSAPAAAPTPSAPVQSAPVAAPAPQEPITITQKASVSKPKAGAKTITVSLKKIKKTKKNKSSVKKIKKVQVQYSTDRTFQTNVKTKTGGINKTKLKIKGLKKNTTYYVRVRYSDNKGGYSKWSKIQKVKTKKK